MFLKAKIELLNTVFFLCFFFFCFFTYFSYSKKFFPDPIILNKGSLKETSKEKHMAAHFVEANPRPLHGTQG